jgi:poly(3-hydroxybutyrate) depolymerase
MTVNGKNRQYTLQLPNNYNSNTAYKLIFGYHWLNGNMGAVVSGQYYGLLPLSGGTAIFVAPDGLNAGWANNGGEDITFTDQMLETIQNSLCVDETNIFATGWSYGGSMSFSAACSRPSRCSTLHCRLNSFGTFESNMTWC